MNAPPHPSLVDPKPAFGKPAIALDQHTYGRGLSCVHCGLCLPACPTYTQTWNEADSPRGRIQLMLALADGQIRATDSVRKHLDLCLDCRACETICPSGVVYHELIEETRPQLERTAPLSLSQRFMRWTFFHILTRPSRLKLALLPARLIRKLNLLNLLPASLRRVASMAPTSGPLFPNALPAFTPGLLGREKKTRVLYFPTCVGTVVYDRVNRMAIDLISACGADVVVAQAPLCCGAIHHHAGATEQAEELARQNIDAILSGSAPAPDFITDAVAGCGAMLRDYPFLLRNDPAYQGKAHEFSAKVRDINELIVQLGMPEMRFPVNETVTYHDACHLAHAQQVTAAPRKLLSQIPGLKLIALPESDTCCGAAGTYNLTQPEMASDLAARKLRNIAATGCTTVAAGNVGCSMHIQAQADMRRQPLTLMHPVELLHRAVFGER